MVCSVMFWQLLPSHLKQMDEIVSDMHMSIFKTTPLMPGVPGMMEKTENLFDLVVSSEHTKQVYFKLDTFTDFFNDSL